jgi:hypothetical protein
MLADISIQSASEIQASFSFEIDTKGKLFREFKLSSDGPFYAWSKASFQCSGDTGQTYGLERMPRADGLVAMKLTSKRPAKVRSLTCVMSGSIDPELISGVLGRDDTGDFLLSLPLPATVSRVEQLLVTVHFPDYISAESLRLDDMTAEEFETAFFPSALTLTAGPIPPRHVKTIELAVGQDIIEAGAGGDEDSGLLSPRLDAFVGLEGRSPVDLNLAVIIFLSALLIFFLLLLRGRTAGSHDPEPCLVFPGIGGLLRAVFTLCMVLLFAVFTLSGAFIEAMVFLGFAVILEMRRSAVKHSSRADEAADAEPVDDNASPADPPPDETEPGAESRGVRRPAFDVRGGRGLLLLLFFSAAGTGATLLAWNLSLQVAQTLACAYLVSSFFLFLSPELLLRRSSEH